MSTPGLARTPSHAPAAASAVAAPPHHHSFATPRANVLVVCRDDAGAEHTFEADGYILRAVSGRFEKALEGINLANHGKPKDKVAPDDRSTSSGSIAPNALGSASQRPLPSPPLPPHRLVLKETAQNMLLLLQFVNYAPLHPFLPANRSFSGRELVALLDLADTFKLKDAPRASLRGYVAKAAHALAMQVADYDAWHTLVRLLEASCCATLARAFFRLDWDGDNVLLLHLHHLSQPWDMPDEVIAQLSPDIFKALVYVETERAFRGGDIKDLDVSWTRSQIVFTRPGRRGTSVAFGDEVPSGRFFRR